MRYAALLIFLLSGLFASSQPPHYKVYAVRFASTGYRFPIASWALGGPENDSVDINFMVWLIKGDMSEAHGRREATAAATSRAMSAPSSTST